MITENFFLSSIYYALKLIELLCETQSHIKWSPTGKARGTSIEIPSYAKASEGYPPVAKSTKASSFAHMKNSATFYAFIHGQSPWSSA
jgi:hypothetical protein